MVPGDLDGDGKPDLVVANSDFSSSNPNLTISVLRNTSTPGSVSFAPGQTFTVGSKPGAVALGDLDGDGKLDLVVANSDNITNVTVNPDTISILRNIARSGPSISIPKSLSPPRPSLLRWPWVIWMGMGRWMWWWATPTVPTSPYSAIPAVPGPSVWPRAWFYR